MPGRYALLLWKSPVVWLLVIVVLALPLMADFNSRLAYSRSLAAEEASLQRQLAAEQARHAALLEFQAYVRSDAYVEHWARLARMGKEGEVAVVPAPQNQNRLTPPTPVVALPPNDAASEWQVLLFGAASAPEKSP
jgi:hypothetical protein